MLDLWLIRHAESVGNVDGTNADTSPLVDGSRRKRSPLPSPVWRSRTSGRLRCRGRGRRPRWQCPAPYLSWTTGLQSSGPAHRRKFSIRRA